MPPASIGGAAALEASGAFAGGAAAGGGGLGLIGAGVGLLGDFLGFSGQQQTNAAQIQLAQQQMAFQKDLATHAMQYRVKDLEAAGLNPMLAVAGGGAQAMPGTMAQLQNPAQAFQQAGQQATGALQLNAQQAQIQQMQAQAQLSTATARKTDSETDTVIPATVAKIQADTGVSTQQAQQIQRNVAMMDILLTPYGGKSMAQETAENQLAQLTIKTHLAQMDQQERSDTLLQLIKARNDSNYAIAIGARNIGNASQTQWGRVLSYFGVPGISGAVSAVGTGAKAAAMLAE